MRTTLSMCSFLHRASLARDDYNIAVMGRGLPCQAGRASSMSDELLVAVVRSLVPSVDEGARAPILNSVHYGLSQVVGQ